MDPSKTTEQGEAEADVEGFRRNLGPFVVAAETTRMPMLFTDATVNERSITFANDALLLLFGYQREELLGKSFNILIGRDADLSALRKIETEFEGDANTNPETWYRRKDGSEFWASLLVSPVPDESGTLVQHFLSIIDLTNHKEAAAKLQAKTAFLEATLENMDQGIMVMDAESRVRLFNQRALALLDLPPELLASDPRVSEIRKYQAQRGDFSRADNAVLNLMQSGNFHSEPFIYERTQTNGNVLEVRTVPLPDGGAVRTYADVTARRRAEEGLRTSEERYRLITENSVDTIKVVGPDLVWRYVSPASRELMGADPEELIGTELQLSVHPEDRERLVSDFQQLFATRTPSTTSANYRLKHKDGRWIPVEVRRRQLLNEQGEPEAIVSSIRDISERLRLEERLRQAQKMEAMGQLTGGVAHDFNNLLTVIQGNAEILVEDQPSDPATLVELAKQILNAAEHAADLTNKLLSFGRRQSLKPVPLALSDVVNGVAGLLHRTLGEQIEVRVESAQTTASALVDKALFESAMLNLALNARDAMPDGGTLSISTGERAATYNDGPMPVGQPVLYVTLTDTGTGIAPEVLQQVFEPFFTTKEVGKGTGLGLSMVYGFAQQSAGHVSIRSEVGVGTSVTLMFPAVQMQQEAAEGDAQAALHRGKGEKVLLVEDDPGVRHFVSVQLVALGYEVEALGAAPDALELIKVGRKFDLLFTDVVLPKGTSGVELAKSVKKIAPEMKVLLTSGYPEEVFRHQGRPDMRLLPKPFRRRDLAEKLRAVLDE